MTIRKTVLILGGTSDIGFATARVYAENAWAVILAARDADAAARNARDLAARNDDAATSIAFDICRIDEHQAFLDRLAILPDTVICAVGLLGQQTRAETDHAHAADILRTNFEAPVLILDEMASRMAKRGGGTIVGISSVAGDRGRASNYIYGSAKAGLTAFLSGLRNRMAECGVHVLTVKPGFVRTKMTEGMKLPVLITAQPLEIGRAIYAAAEITKRNVIYVRPVWWLIMSIITNIPERIFKKMRL